MIKRTTKLRARRVFRRRKRQVEEMSTQAEAHLDRHFFRRLERLGQVRRFIGIWILLLIALVVGLIMQTRQLDGYYLSLQPSPGGTYTEGILGAFTNANPIYASTVADSSVARLVFGSLLTYSPENKLVGDLAQSWQVDEHETRYSVHLRPHLTWEDGQPLTADDVVFTYQVIQNADAKSPLFNSWLGIAVTAADPNTVVFTLPNALTSFPHSLTNGIIPKHILGGIPMTALRSSIFNTTKPIGAGPFKWQAIEVHGDKPENREERIALVPNELYHGDSPKLDKFIIRCFHNENALLASFKGRELNGAEGFDSLIPELRKNSSIHSFDIPLTSEVMVFLKNNQEILQDVNVRKAVLLATNTNAVIAGLGYPVIPASEPLLKSDIGFDKKYAQSVTNIEEAKRLLDSAGWAVGPTGIRTKNGKTLSFNVYSQNNSEFTSVTQALQKQWRTVGIDAGVTLQPSTDLQTTIAQHAYDALVYGISIGPDPDVFVYWHSSQADIRSATRRGL